MTNEQLRIKFWQKMDKEERSFSWFHRNYIAKKTLAYNTFYKQAKGQELTEMSEELTEAIKKYICE